MEKNKSKIGMFIMILLLTVTLVGATIVSYNGVFTNAGAITTFPSGSDNQVYNISSNATQTITITLPVGAIITNSNMTVVIDG